MTTGRGKSGAPPVFELRSTSVTLVVLALKTTDMAAIEYALVDRFGDTPGMFDHDPVVIDVSQAEGDPLAIDWPLLAALMWRFDMVAAAVRGGTPQQMAAAFAAGLGEAPDAATPVTRPASPSAATPAVPDTPAAAAAVVDVPASVPVVTPTVPAAALEAPRAPVLAEPPGPAPLAASSEFTPAGLAQIELPPPAAAATLIVDKPLRSGQQVYARGGDLVVLAAVNVGAEVIADGSIHVYAPLRGKAVAGAKGDTAARIFSICMEPQLIAIAGTYRTTESPLPAGVWAKPAQIRLDGERLVFEPLA